MLKRRSPDGGTALGARRGQTDEPAPNEAEEWSKPIKQLPYFIGRKVHIFP